MRSAITLLILFISKGISAQSIPNQSFDSLCICAIDRVWEWVTSDIYQTSNDTVVLYQPNSHYSGGTLDVHFAMSSVQINYTDSDTSRQMKSVMIHTDPNIVYPSGEPFRGFITNGNQFYTNSNGEIDLIKGGTPFPFRPGSIIGYYKFENTSTAQLDFGKVVAILKKYNSSTGSYDTIGIAESTNQLASTANWTKFEIPFDYNNTAVPDSIVVAIFASTIGDTPATLWIDDLSFSSNIGVNGPTRAPLLIYPNPTNGMIYIDQVITDQRHYTLFSIEGKKMREGTLQDELDISALDNGIYFIRIKDGDIDRTYRVVKE